jgi:hypothetical protein
MKFTGQKAQVFIDNFSSTGLITTGTTTANTKYFVIAKAATSTIPVAAGTIFISPKSGTQISLVSGDELFRIDPERFCKTSASFEVSMGSVDVSDDCDPGATITDGIVSFTGSLAGLFRYDEITQDFDNVTDFTLNHFFDIVNDNGTGTYTTTARNDTQIYLLTLLNSGAATGNTENWLFSPITISSFSMSLGNADAQNKELSFSKGEGKTIIYKWKV